MRTFLHDLYPSSMFLSDSRMIFIISISADLLMLNVSFCWYQKIRLGSVVTMEFKLWKVIIREAKRTISTEIDRFSMTLSISFRDVSPHIRVEFRMSLMILWIRTCFRMFCVCLLNWCKDFRVLTSANSVWTSSTRHKKIVVINCISLSRLDRLAERSDIEIHFQTFINILFCNLTFVFNNNCKMVLSSSCEYSRDNHTRSLMWLHV
jgi:hypothetical protein